MNLFSYDSKFSQTLMYVADLCILNVVFVLCCIPIFTIGAAQSALYSAIRTLQDPEDDTAPVKAFFKAFRTDFKTITLAWGLGFLVILAVAVVFCLVLALAQSQASAPVWMCAVALCLLIVVHTQIPLFHARFGCTVWQLVRNSFFLCLAHPIRAILLAVLVWLPVIAMYFMDLLMLMTSSLVWLLLYYAVALMLGFNLMKKPYKELIEKAKGETPESEAAEENPAEEG